VNVPDLIDRADIAGVWKGLGGEYVEYKFISEHVIHCKPVGQKYYAHTIDKHIDPTIGEIRLRDGAKFDLRRLLCVVTAYTYRHAWPLYRNPDPVGVARRGWRVGSHEPLQAAPTNCHRHSDHRRSWTTTRRVVTHLLE